MLYAPRIPGAHEIRAIREATSKPLNVLAGPGLSVAAIIESGGQRISVGGRLAWVAINAMAGAAEQLREGGDLPSLADAAPINEWLSA